jgi:hypothetical protein
MKSAEEFLFQEIEKCEEVGKSEKALKIQKGKFEKKRKFRDSISPSSGPT